MCLNINRFFRNSYNTARLNYSHVRLAGRPVCHITRAIYLAQMGVTPTFVALFYINRPFFHLSVSFFCRNIA